MNDHCQAPPIDSGTGAVTGHDRPEHRSGIATAPRGWPHVSVLELGSLPTAVGCARAHARLVLAEWGLTHVADDALIVVSELVTNALQASWDLPDRPPIVLRLLADDWRLIIEIWDQSPQDVEPREVDADAQSGRGLTAVAALSTRWGCKRTGYACKAVWAELAL